MKLCLIFCVFAVISVTSSFDRYTQRWNWKCEEQIHKRLDHIDYLEKRLTTCQTQPKECGPLPEIENGHFNDSSGSVANVVCDDLYHFFGRRQQVTCTESGTWSNVDGQCNRVEWNNFLLEKTGNKRQINDDDSADTDTEDDDDYNHHDNCEHNVYRMAPSQFVFGVIINDILSPGRFKFPDDIKTGWSLDFIATPIKKNGVALYFVSNNTITDMGIFMNFYKNTTKSRIHNFKILAFNTSLDPFTIGKEFTLKLTVSETDIQTTVDGISLPNITDVTAINGSEILYLPPSFNVTTLRFNY